MTDPTTSNILLAVPTRGSDPGTWDIPVNSNTSAIDGYFGGVQTISVSSAPLTLTAPSGTVTAGGGPTQAQNAVLRFTGTLTANVTVTLPLPGYYVIENLTTGNFLLIFQAFTATQIIAVDQGMIQHIYNDGANVRFVNLGEVGKIEMWAGISTMPAWVTACTVPPYVLNDGTIYNFSTYPYLGKRLGSAFGGNGVTTFGVPDSRGRVLLPYDGTGTRITSAGCNLNGQVIGAAGGDQNLQQHAHTYSGNTGLESVGHTHLQTLSQSNQLVTTGNGSAGQGIVPNSTPTGTESANHTHAYSGTTATSGSGTTSSNNVQPSQVVGISVIRAA